MKKFIIFIFLNLFILVKSGSVGYSKPSPLYDSNDKLVILTHNTFNSTVYNKTNIWIVEFYNSWCGFCQRFAPVWKEFAISVNAWKGVVEVGVVDCADADNNPLCRNLEIMSYPSIRVFAPHSAVNSTGADLTSDKSKDGMRHALLDVIEKEQQNHPKSPWPNLAPYRSSEFNNLWNNVASQIKHTFIIFEDTDSYLGREVILDYQNVRSAQIRRVLKTNEAFIKLSSINKIPSVGVMPKDMNEIMPLITEENTRETYDSAIRSFLVTNGGISDVNALREIPKQIKPNVIEHEKGSSYVNVPDVVYKADLENALRFSLYHEIALHRVMTGEKLIALQHYLRMLASFFPTKSSGTMFLERLRDWVLSQEDAIKGEDFVKKIKEYENEFDFKIPEYQDWIGCRGSNHSYRGYTCGLWTMFHTLTVSAATQNKKRLTPGSEDVLKSILKYVKYFFGCEGCSKHFQQMAADRKLENIKEVNDAVMWLWESHNVVNKRLKGDQTEDPNHPKVQFPLSSSCFDCKLEGEDWDKNNVLKYLKQRYGKINICPHTGAAISLCAPYNAKETSTIGKSISYETMEVTRGWDFNLADVSLCVLLYLCSAIILVLVYIKFVVKRRSKKKYYMN